MMIFKGMLKEIRLKMNVFDLKTCQWSPVFRLLIFILFSSGLLGQSKLSTKRAFLIGVGAYPTEGEWATLNSKNDIELIKEALKSQGFSEENITAITDEQATRQNILDLIKMKLIKEVDKGDIVYFHFSGHGQQKQDQDGDEVDGYDECIVPYDSPKKFKEGVYAGEKLITDDELRKLFENVRKQLSPSGQLIVALDACHSGTGTRGMAVSRGTTEPMASPDYIKNHSQQKLLKENNQINENLKVASSGLAPMVAFFGSAQNQVNYEMTTDQGKQYGSLSYAISKYLVNSKQDESYRGLFDKIKIEMSTIAPLQQPQAEGDLDLEILNGKLLGTANYYKVISAPTDEQIIINAGFLQGVNEGSVVGFFNRETRDIISNMPIVTGKIQKCFSATSIVVLDSFISPETLTSSWVYILEKSMGGVKIAVDVNLSDKQLEEKIKSKLYSYSFINEDRKNARLFISDKNSGPGNGFLTLSTLDNFVLDSFLIETMNDASVLKLAKKITRYLQGQFLRKLEIESSDLVLRFEIIPVGKNTFNGDSIKLIPLKEDATGLRQLKVGDNFQILIINEGIKPAYFTLIDIQPDNMFNFLFPFEDQTAEELRIIPGQKKLMDQVFTVWPPRGNEIFKLVASAKPLDLKSAYGTRGFKSQNPFEKLFSETENLEFYNTRGGRPVTLGNMEIDTYSQSFLIAN